MTMLPPSPASPTFRAHDGLTTTDRIVGNGILLRLGVWFGLSAAVLGGCGEDETQGGDVGVTDTAASDSSGNNPGGVPDITDDSANVLDGADLADTEEELENWGIPTNPNEGEFGWPCEDNSVCYSGFCVESQVGKICTDACIEECPPSWACSQVTNTGGDTTYICKPHYLHLCNPCETHTDCSDSAVLSNALCIDYGAIGKFCGGDCSGNFPCPAGYDCMEVESPTGPPAKQCVKKNATCPCTPAAVAKNLVTTCNATNEFGVCYGKRWCTPDGLTDCDASVPAVEICDTKDNNCNGKIDDMTVAEICDIKNEHGVCKGEVDCVGGIANCLGPSAAPEICDGLDNDCDGNADEDFGDADGDKKADCLDEDDDNDGILDAADNCPLHANPTQEDFDGDGKGDACDGDDDNDGVVDESDCNPNDGKVYPGAQELCDGLDNNCNGIADDGLCYDGNPCTNDVCDPANGCVYAPFAGPCDDGSACTTGDKCVEGACKGDQKNCSDGNPCTSDLCGVSQGCYNVNADGTPCEDGNQCTVNDSCQNAVCKSGPLAACNDGNECTKDSCNPAQGCIHDAAGLNGAPCDDDDACSIESKCSGGQCSKTKSYDCGPYAKQQGCFLATCVDGGFLGAVCFCI